MGEDPINLCNFGIDTWSRWFFFNIYLEVWT